MKRLRSRLSYSNVMVTVLAFVVLGGTAYAATELGKNSVGTKQLKNGAVTKAKIAKSAQKALKGAEGPKGAPGAKGEKGDTGPKGSDASGIMLARVNGVPFSTSNSWGGPSGTSAVAVSSGAASMRTPFTTPVKVDGFTVFSTVPVGIGCGIPGTCFEIVSLAVNGENALTCVIPFASTICSSGAASVTIAPGAEVAIRANETVASGGTFDLQASYHVSPT
jgi:hypothetical protein